MRWRLIKTIIVLPGNVLVFIPAVILWVAKDTKYSAVLTTADRLSFWLALVAGGIGYGLAIWTVSIFMEFGHGTPAPWDPPKKFVVRGPFRLVRNPMIIGVLFLLSAEAMMLQSWPLAAWMFIFFIGNAIYFPFVEEKRLEKRFGMDYRQYKTQVPRWIPRIHPWKQVNDNGDAGSVRGISD